MVLVERCLVDDGSDVPDWIEVTDEWNGVGEAPLFGSIRSLSRLTREGRGRGGFFNLMVSDRIWQASEWSVSGRGGFFRQSFQLDAVGHRQVLQVRQRLQGPGRQDHR